MSRDEAAPRDEEYAALLAAFDDALAGGAAPPRDGAPAELRPRLAEDLECLHLLHQLRPPAPDCGLRIADCGLEGQDTNGAPALPRPEAGELSLSLIHISEPTRPY